MKTFDSVDVHGDTVQSEAVVLVDAGGFVIDPATETTQNEVLQNLQTLNSLVPTQYDFIGLGYTGTDLTTVVYKLGGPAGVVVSTLTLAYVGGLMTSVSKT